MSNRDNRADVARRDPEDVLPLSIGGQIDHFIQWKRAESHAALLHEAGHLLLGLVLLAAVTGLYFWLEVPLDSAAFTYLVVIVLLSLVSSFSSLIVLSVIGVCCLSYFFAPPIYSFRVDYPQDLGTISAFVITAFIISILVTRVRVEQRDHMRTCETLRHVNQRLEATNNALLVENVERKRAERALRESEYKLRQIIDTVPGLIWSTGPDGEPTHVSKRLLDYSGLQFEDFKHAGWKELVHPDDFPEATKAYQAIQIGTSYRGVLRLRRGDGEFRWHLARCEPLRDLQGRIIQWYGLSVDIDEGKKAEEWPKFVAQLQAILNVLPTYTWYAAPSGGLTFVNKRTADYLGLPNDHPLRFGIDIGAQWDDWVPLLHPDDHEEARKYWSNCLRTGEAGEHSYRARSTHGDYRWFLTRFEPLRASDGTLQLWIGATLDIEELKCAEQALRESEGKFRDYAETTSDWFWEIDPDYKFTLLTENAFESDPAARIGTACWEHALDLETEPDKWRVVRDTLDARRPFRDFVYRTVNGNGTPIYVKASGKPVFDTRGEFRGYRGTGADVTATMRAREEHEKLRRLESDLAHMNRIGIVGEQAASLVHEITQPIATARNNARAAQNFLERQPPKLGEAREALACVVGDADRAGEIIERIRDHIRKAPPRKSRFDLNEAIDEVIVLGRSAIAKNEVLVQTHLAEGVFPVQGDRVQLQQVILNLVLNAVEAMGALEAGPRELLISTKQTEPNGVLIAVRDSGPGIDPEHVERVFEAFYTTKTSGVGMGLSICRSIIDAHGGRLWADANEPRGAVFQFTLPGAENDLANGAPRERAA